MKKENKKMKYVAVDIGCIECGEESSVLGIFDDMNEATDILKKCGEYQQKHWCGQHSFEIFEIKEENKLIDNYYAKAIEGEDE